MAKKGKAGAIAAAVKKSTGDRSYHIIKEVAYSVAGFFRLFRVLSPGDLAYRLFPLDTDRHAGYVTVVDARGISGMAFRPEGEEPVRVSLLVDGIEINRTWASQKVPNPTRYRGLGTGFYFPMKRVWSHILRSQEISVVAADGRSFRYRAGPGVGRPLPNRGVSTLEGKGIVQLVGEGQLITKFGRLQAPRNESKQWAARTFGHYAELNETFERVVGKSLFAFYGAMLGFAREGGILAHDMDLDLAYFSDEPSPERVRAEFFDIASRLMTAGVTVVPNTYKLQFGGMGLSLTPCWISDGRFSSTFGYVGDGYTVTRNDILPLRRAEHDGYGLLLPNEPAAVAAYLYGKGWKYPDPGWKWLPEYKSWPDVLAARLSEKEVRELERMGSASR